MRLPDDVSKLLTGSTVIVNKPEGPTEKMRSVYDQTHWIDQ